MSLNISSPLLSLFPLGFQLPHIVDICQIESILDFMGCTFCLESTHLYPCSVKVALAVHKRVCMAVFQ